MLSSAHLMLCVIRLKSGDAWSQPRTGLAFLFCKGGAGECVSDELTRPVAQGDMLILNGPKSGRLVSTNGDMVLWCFLLSIEHLYPLFAGSEISLLQNVFDRLKGFRHYAATTPLAVECNSL